MISVVRSHCTLAENTGLQVLPGGASDLQHCRFFAILTHGNSPDLKHAL